MPITRNTDQHDQTLEQFYEGLAAGPHAADALVGQNMLAFVAMVNDTFVRTRLWGLTSMARLVIQAEDDWKAPWYVIVAASPILGQYELQYLLPPDRAPWPHATVHGEAQSLAAARRYLLLAMRECGGWPIDAELRQLLAAYPSAPENPAPGSTAAS